MLLRNIFSHTRKNLLCRHSPTLFAVRSSSLQFSYYPTLRRLQLSLPYDHTINNHFKRISIFRAMSSSSFPVTANLTAKITEAFEPSHLEVINESHMHNVPPESESHFKVVIVSAKFETAKSPLARHRMVNSVLSEELAPPSQGGTVHALSIVAKTPAQWEKMQANNVAIEPSPSCRGGDGSLPPKISK